MRVAIFVGNGGGVVCCRDGVDAGVVPLRHDVLLVGRREFWACHIAYPVRSDHVIRLSGDVADSTVGRGERAESAHGGWEKSAVCSSSALRRAASVVGLAPSG